MVSKTQNKLTIKNCYSSITVSSVDARSWYLTCYHFKRFSFLFRFFVIAESNSFPRNCQLYSFTITFIDI